MASSPEKPPALAPYNVTLLPFSPIFDYGAIRDMDAAQGWNASYTNDIYTTAHDNQTPAGIAYRRTQAAKAGITFTFQGTGMYLCFSNGGANFTLTLDGGIWTTATSAANQPVCEHAKDQADTLSYASGLKYGSHTVVLDVSASSKQEFRFFGGALEIGVQTGGKTVDDSLMVDDQDPQWKYTPERGALNGWATSPGLYRTYHGTGTFTCLYDRSAYATYTFSGAGGAILSAVVWPEGHAVSVQLDDAPPVELSLTSIWWEGSAPFYLAGGLDPDKEHTLTVRNFKSAVPDCNSERVFKLCCTSIDAVQLLRAGENDLNPPASSQDPLQPPDGNGQPRDTKPDSSKKSNTPVIAGGAVAATAAIIVIVLTVFFLVRWRRRGRNEQSPFVAWPTGSGERPTRPDKAQETGRSSLMSPYTMTDRKSVV